MRASTRWMAAPLLCLATLSAGCGSSTDNGPLVAAVVALSGDAQLGTAGVALPHPLLVKVTDATGGLVKGAAVSWVVTAGGGSVPAPSGVTDQTGRAQVNWTLGPSVGTQTIEARVEGVAPAIFSATAAQPGPCTLPMPYAVGASVAGALAASDCHLVDGSYIDYYGFSEGTPQSRRFTIESDSFDTFLFINDAAGNALALDNDGTGTTNASLRILLGGGGYRVGVNSLEAATVGPYTLSSSTVPDEVTNCEDVWATDGVSVVESISATDCLDPSGPYYTDGLLVWLQIRQLITVSEHSDDFDALVGLFDPSTGKVVATDDDSGPGRDAVMSYTAEHAGEFIILATTFLADKTGSYTLTIQSPLADTRDSAPGTSAGYTAASLLQMIHTQGDPGGPAASTGGVRAALAGAPMRRVRAGK